MGASREVGVTDLLGTRTINVSYMKLGQLQQTITNYSNYTSLAKLLKILPTTKKKHPPLQTNSISPNVTDHFVYTKLYQLH